MALGPLFFGSLLVAVIWRAELHWDAREVSWGYLIWLCAVCTLMTVQSYLGSELVYRFGAGVRGRYQPLPVEHQGPQPRNAGDTRPEGR